MHKIKIAALLFLLFPVTGISQIARTYTSSEILLQIKKLNVLGSVLYIAAHPDDENTRLLSWLANEKLYRTAYLSITRGDGGQNLIGDEQGVELGLIRTQELLAARRIDGAEQFFTCGYDFGYSKSPEETMNFWVREKVLSDVVWVIRSFRPDIIITRFPTTGEGGHGHHTASAMLAEEAFDAAGDPGRFPEQLKNSVTAWKPERLLWNTFNFGSANTQKEDQFKLDVGGFNPLLGKSYGELAALSRSQHKSQGFGVPSQRGSIIEYFAPIKGEKPVSSLMEGIDISWNRLGLKGAEKIIGKIVSSFDVNDPSRSVNDLLQLHTLISSSQSDPVLKKLKLEEVQKLIALCSGLYMEAIASSPFGVQGDSLKINAVINVRSGAVISGASVKCFGKEMVFSGLQPNVNAQVTLPLFIDPNTPVSQPYWLEDPMVAPGRFAVKAQQLVGKPESDPPAAVFSITMAGKVFIYTVPIQYKYTDPVKGEILDPLCIVSPVSLRANPSLLLKKGNEKPIIHAEISSLKATALKPGKIPGSFGNDFINVARDSSLNLQKNEKRTAVFYSDKEGVSELAALADDRMVIKELRTISYDHIPVVHYQRPARIAVIPIDLQTGRIKKVGYIDGAGDKVPDALMQMGYSVEFIKEEDLVMPAISRFDAIVTGVRAYNTREWLYARNAVLMEYVDQGGNLLIQYNTNSWAGPAKGSFGPYPFVISRNRVTDEKSPVSFLIPDDPAFNEPNKLTEKDFDNWVQERSVYHADKTDARYRKILGLKDPGENEQDGSIIIGEYGKGNFIYTGLAFFRQLPYGVSGAYRLLANLLALP